MESTEEKEVEEETIHLKFLKVPFGGSLLLSASDSQGFVWAHKIRGNPKFKLY